MDGLCIEGLSCVDDVCQTAVAEESGSASETTTPETTDSVGTTESVVTMSESSEVESTSDGPCTAPEIECDGVCVNALSDPQHCGECGKVCDTVLDSGGCVQGACRPVWSDCVDASNVILCPEVCQSQGFVGCATAACGDENMSVWWFGNSVDCESGIFSPEAEANACEVEPNGMNSFFYRCCCDQN